MPNRDGLTGGTADNIGGDGIGFISNLRACDDPRKKGVIEKLKCYKEQIENIRVKSVKKVTVQKAKDRGMQEEGLLKKIRQLLFFNPWLNAEYSHLIPDDAKRPS